MLKIFSRLRIILICLFALIAVVWYYFMKADAPRKVNHFRSSHPDYSADNVSYKVFNKNGNLQVEIKTLNLKHYPTTNKVRFQKPLVEIRQQKMPWIITADHGESYKDGDEDTIEFIGHVRLHQNAYLKRVATTISMDNLLYYPKSKRAATNGTIIMEQPGLKIQSVGMRADLQKQQIDLLNTTWGHYAPH